MVNQITTDVQELLVGTALALKNYTDGKEQTLNATIAAEVQALNQKITANAGAAALALSTEVMGINQAIVGLQANVADNMNEAQYTLTQNVALADAATAVASELQQGRNTIVFAVAYGAQFTVTDPQNVGYEVKHRGQISFTYLNGQITNVVFMDDHTVQVVAASVNAAVTNLTTQMEALEGQQALDKLQIKNALSAVSGLTYNW